MDTPEPAAPPENPDDLAVGTPVCKPLGYPFPGVVVGRFETLTGKVRYCVERVGPDEEPEDLLHIFNRAQLQVRTPSTDAALREPPAKKPRKTPVRTLVPLTKEEHEVLNEANKHLDVSRGVLFLGAAERVAAELGVEVAFVKVIIEKGKRRNDPRVGKRRYLKGSKAAPATPAEDPDAFAKAA